MTSRYQDVLDRLDAAFPTKEMLTKAEIAKWMGVHVNTISRRYGWPRGKISKAEVARAVSEE